jgi:hypothetical protein
MKEEQLREDQRREALARREEPAGEETLPPPAQVQAPVETPSPVMHAEPVTAEPRAEPVRAEPVRSGPQPKIDPKTLLESDGLVMIETDRSKAPVSTPAVEEPQHLGRPRRERPKAQEEELQQVETKR